MNILWILVLCSPTACVSLGTAYTNLVDCERELTPTAILSMACEPWEGI